MGEVIILMSPAKSSHDSPTGTGTDDSAAAKTAVGMPAAEELKAVAEGSVGDSQNAGALSRGNISAMLRPRTVAPTIAARYD
jgi:hypothetical protein